MLDKILIIDNFLHVNIANKIRQEAIDAKYIDWLGHDGQVYKRISIVDNQDIRDTIEKHCGKVDMLGMAFRLNYEGEEPNQSIHTDVGWGTHALVLYLNDGPSGTAFWKHKPSGKDRLNPHDLMTYSSVRKDWTDESKWEQIDFVPMIFNRGIIYESELFHSRWPFKAFGSMPEDSRLIAVAFFTPTGERIMS